MLKPSTVESVLLINRKPCSVQHEKLKETNYHRITHYLTMHMAQTLHKIFPDMTFTHVSGIGTNSAEKGRSIWAREKSKTENELPKLFEPAYMLRPGYIQPS